MNIHELFKEIATKGIAELIIVIGTLFVGGLIGWFATFKQAKQRIIQAENRVTRVYDGNNQREGKGLWLSKPLVKPARYERLIDSSKPIMVVGNLKGGVGKTTVATNLAAHYAIKKNEKVLLIDADYQGSASSMLFTPTSRIPTSDMDSASTVAFSGFCTDEMFGRIQQQSNSLGMVHDLSVWAIASYYDLAQAENRLMIEWVINAEDDSDGIRKVGHQDVRYILANLLHSDNINGKFDRVIIDAPPRLTCACIQSFCAATDLVIPTVLDDLSGEAVGSFVSQINLLRREKICPRLKILGVIPYVPSRATNFRVAVRSNISSVLRKTKTEAELLDPEFEIPTLPLISENAGSLIPYAKKGNNDAIRAVRAVFDKLGDELDSRRKRIVLD